VIIALSGGGAPASTGPQGACNRKAISFVSRREPLGADPRPTATANGTVVDPPAIELQRIRERLELAAIVAGCSHPEQAAAALLGEGVSR
jgi:hypothetical protein